MAYIGHGVLLAKIREPIGKRRAKMKLWGSVKIDGKYIGAHIKPENKKEERIDRRLKENQNGKRMCVLSIREHNPDAPNRTITRVVSDENPKAAWAAVRDHVQPQAVLTADEHGSYDDLVGLAILKPVNHSKAYQTEDGTDTNRIESFFARAERSYVGIYHRFSVKYLAWYMAMVACKEHTRYMGLHLQLSDVLRAVTHCTTSNNLCGYRQGAAERIDDQVWHDDAKVEKQRYLL
jgi:hypothetical protein